MSKLTKLEEVALHIYSSDVRVGIYDSFLIADEFLKTSNTEFKNNEHNQLDVKQIDVKDPIEVLNYDSNSYIFNGNEIIKIIEDSESELIKKRVISPVQAYEEIACYVKSFVNEKIKIMNS